jgi:hypothetical protein
MTLDNTADFVKLTVSTGYDQNATSIVLSGGGSSLPAVSWNATWWNSTDYPDPSDDPNREIVRVTNVSGNTLTIVRGQETAYGSLAASTKNTAGKTYKLILGITAKMMADIGNNLQKPWQYVNVQGTINSVNTTFTISPLPFDPASVQLRLARQPQEQGLDYTILGGTITYITPPDISLSGLPHIAQYQ